MTAALIIGGIILIALGVAYWRLPRRYDID